ncbi:hypothetical protein PIB30_067038 [Stylosanthes scabra]|uniref:Uncharacterized protein n=1 Tax=Stylosanthes scabra TaxID=79078 RepID=A0ABU6RMZ3_9FABA|nr:hypothetical protein [Stylosanthes scabra]
MAGIVHLADLEPPGRKMPEETQPPRKLKKSTRRRNSRHARDRPKFLQPQAVCHPGSKPVTQKLKAYEPEKASQQGSKSRTYQRIRVGIITGNAKPQADGRQHSQDS